MGLNDYSKLQPTEAVIRLLEAHYRAARSYFPHANFRLSNPGFSSNVPVFAQLIQGDTWHQIGAVNDVIHWSSDQFVGQMCAAFGIEVDFDRKGHPSLDTTSQHSEELGRELSEALIPFLRFDGVTPRHVYRLAAAFAHLASPASDLAFVNGFQDPMFEMLAASMQASKALIVESKPAGS